MRKLIRVLAGVVVFGALLTSMPATPASADHDCLPGSLTNAPCPPDTLGNRGDPAGWHEEQPNLMFAGFEALCFVVGTVKGGNAPSGSTGHPPPGPPPGIDDPAHSHFEFIETAITCDDGAVAVTAEGGNDGHSVNYTGGSNENDPTQATPNCIYEHLVANGEGLHHGSMTESGWSHSSGYSGGPARCGPAAGGGTTEHNGGNSGRCQAAANVAGGPGHNNKADISITTSAGATVGGAPSFAKYRRLGNVVYAWGCSNAFEAQPYSAPFKRRFSTILSIGPDPRTAVFPLCVVPGGTGCDLILSGPAHRSNAWLPI